MNNDNIFISCHKGDWKELADLLEEQISQYAESGNVVLFCRALSYYGVSSLLNGNDFSASTLYKQISEEYADMEDDPRVKASYARFLALYYSFSNSAEAAKYYREARILYSQTDWYQDEAMTLLESVYMHYIFSDDRRELYLILGRLEMLNDHLGGYLNKDLMILNSIVQRNITAEANLKGLEKLDVVGASIMALILLLFIRDSKGLKESINTLRAKAIVFKHPWYSNRFNKLQSQLPDSNSVKSIDLEADRIAISLFDKSLLSSKEIAVGFDSYKSGLGKELLLYLATRSNLQAHKDAIVELFFMDETVEKSYNRLYVNIHRINRELQEHFKIRSSSLIFIKQGIVYINPDVFGEIDTQKYRKIMSVANQLWANDKEAALELMQQAAAMYSDEIAPGFCYQDWLEDYRLELKSMQIKALHRIFLYHMDKHDSNACTEAFYCLIEQDSLNEDYYIEYTSYLLNESRSTEAKSLYHKYETRLKKELGLSPSFKLKSLIAQICEVDQ